MATNTYHDIVMTPVLKKGDTLDDTHMEVYITGRGDACVLPFLLCDNIPYKVWKTYWMINIFHNKYPKHGWGCMKKVDDNWQIITPNMKIICV